MTTDDPAPPRDPWPAVAAVVQHEVNNLLAVLHGNLMLLRRSPAAAEGAGLRQCERLELATTRLETTLAALFGALRRPPGPRSLRLTAVVAALAPLLRLVLPRRLDLEVGEGDAPVRFDPAALEVALLRAALATAAVGGARLALVTRRGELRVELDAAVDPDPVHDGLAAVAAGVTRPAPRVLVLRPPPG